MVRGCQAPKRISAQPGGARKRARLRCTERSCTSGLYSGSELRAILRRVKHVELRDGWTVITTTWRKSRASVSGGIHEGFRPFLRSPPLGAASGRHLQVGRFAASVLSVPPLVRRALSGKNRWDGTED